TEKDRRWPFDGALDAYGRLAHANAILTKCIQYYLVPTIELNSTKATSTITDRGSLFNGSGLGVPAIGFKGDALRMKIGRGLGDYRNVMFAPQPVRGQPDLFFITFQLSPMLVNHIIRSERNF